MTDSTSISNSRVRFLAACRCERLDRPPVWLMRQAGRALPEYRALRAKHSFLELVQTPELAAEVTLQPIRRFQFDAAILFSDILVVPEAMGQRYAFGESGGIGMEFAVQSAADVERLSVGAVREHADYVARALQLIKPALGGSTALIGFAGAPWTLANFMLEGGSGSAFAKARALLRTDPALFHRLCEKLSQAVSEYLRMQVEAGAEVVQVFDSLAGLLGDAEYEEVAGRWNRAIIAALGGQVPVILFAKGINRSWPVLAGTGANVLSVDWTVRLADVRAALPPHVGVQGNLDPALLTTTPQRVTTETVRLLQDMRGVRGHIVNLGHGVPPAAKLENLQALVDTVRSFV